MDRLIAMQTFVRVAELGSFSRAAQALNVPNATVSMRVAQLEDHLQLRLLLRTTRRVSLTHDGAAYFEWVGRVLGEIAEVEEQLQGKTRTPRGRIRVDVPASAGRHVIAPALPDFLARYPDITVDLGSSDRPVDLIQEGVDCVIRGGVVADELLVARRLGEFEVTTCAAPAYLARHGVPQSPLQLDGHRAVNFFSARTGRVMPLDFFIDGRMQEVAVPHQVGANDADTYIALTLQGLGIAQLVRTRQALDYFASGQLVPILTEWRPSRLPLFVVYPRNRHLSARVRVFVDWVLELYGGIFADLEREAG